MTATRRTLPRIGDDMSVNKSDLPSRFQNKTVSVEDAIAWVGELTVEDALSDVMRDAVVLLLSTIRPLRDENAKLRAEATDRVRTEQHYRNELQRIDRIIELAAGR